MRAMFQGWRKLAPIILLLVGCGSQITETYQADRTPEYRDSYNGIAGVIQWQKDQSGLVSKEQGDKCEQIKTLIVQAQLTNNHDLAEQLSIESRRVCIYE